MLTKEQLHEQYGEVEQFEVLDDAIIDNRRYFRFRSTYTNTEQMTAYRLFNEQEYGSQVTAVDGLTVTYAHPFPKLEKPAVNGTSIEATVRMQQRDGDQ